MGQRANVAVLGATVGVSAFPAGASAEERTCRGTIAAATVDNLRVPQRANRIDGISSAKETSPGPVGGGNVVQATRTVGAGVYHRLPLNDH